MSRAARRAGRAAAGVALALDPSLFAGCGEELGVTNCAYAYMDADQDGFTIRGDWARDGTSSIVGHYSLAAFGEKAVNNLRAGKPLIINDNLKEIPPEAAASFQKIGIGATICMPW